MSGRRAWTTELSFTYETTRLKPQTWVRTPILNSSVKFSRHLPMAGVSSIMQLVITVPDFFIPLGLVVMI
jgi:hypothetical protein